MSIPKKAQEEAWAAYMDAKRSKTQAETSLAIAEDAWQCAVRAQMRENNTLCDRCGSGVADPGKDYCINCIDEVL